MHNRNALFFIIHAYNAVTHWRHIALGQLLCNGVSVIRIRSLFCNYYGFEVSRVSTESAGEWVPIFNVGWRGNCPGCCSCMFSRTSLVVQWLGRYQGLLLINFYLLVRDSYIIEFVDRYRGSWIFVVIKYILTEMSYLREWYSINNWLDLVRRNSIWFW